MQLFSPHDWSCCWSAGWKCMLMPILLACSWPWSEKGLLAVPNCQCRDLWLIKILAISDSQCQTMNRAPISTYPSPRPTRLREHHWKEAKEMRARGWGEPLWHAVFCSWHEYCAHDFTVNVHSVYAQRTRTKYVHDQGSQNSILDRQELTRPYH